MPSGIEPIDAGAICPKPEHAFSVLKYRDNKIITQTVYISRYILVAVENVVFWIILIKPTASGSNPDFVGPILTDG